MQDMYYNVAALSMREFKCISRRFSNAAREMLKSDGTACLTITRFCQLGISAHTQNQYKLHLCGSAMVLNTILPLNRSASAALHLYQLIFSAEYLQWHWTRPGDVTFLLACIWPS